MTVALYRTEEGTYYKKTEDTGKVFWYVSHDNGESWLAISGNPSVECTKEVSYL